MILKPWLKNTKAFSFIFYIKEELKKMKARCINYDGKYTGTIDNIETYKSLRDGKIDFNPNIKSKISHIMIPYDLFINLMEMDKECKNND